MGNLRKVRKMLIEKAWWKRGIGKTRKVIVVHLPKRRKK